MAASPSTLSLSQQEGPLELIHAESGLQLLELPAGPRKVKLAVPPGTYLVRKRLPEGNLVREIQVTAGGVNELSEAQLTLVGYAGLAAKSAAAPATKPETRPVPAAHLDLGAQQPATDDRRWYRAGALISAGFALAAFGMSVKYARDVNEINSELNPYRRFPCVADGTSACTDVGGNQSAAPLTPPEQDYVQQLQDEGKKFERYQYTALGTSAVALAVSAPFFYFWLRGEPEAPGGAKVSLAPLLAPGQAGMGAQLRF